MPHRRRLFEELGLDARSAAAAFTLFFDFAGDAVILADADTGALREMNRRAAELTGHKRGDVARLSLRDLLVHPGAPDVAGFLAARGTVREQEMTLTHKKGHTVP